MVAPLLAQLLGIQPPEGATEPIPELLKAACDSMVTLNAFGVGPMRDCGAHAATDVTGFGLAGHAFEMAEGSHTTIVLDLKALPLFPGADRIDVTKFRTRASKSNREYTEADTHFENAEPGDERISLTNRLTVPERLRRPRW